VALLLPTACLKSLPKQLDWDLVTPSNVFLWTLSPWCTEIDQSQWVTPTLTKLVWRNPIPHTVGDT